MKKSFFGLLFAMTGVVLACTCHLEINDPWLRATTGGMTAGYFVIKNNGSGTKRLVGVTFDNPALSNIDIHQTITDGNVSKMVSVVELPIESKTSLEFKQGGNHVMAKVTGELKDGDKIKGTLLFKDVGADDSKPAEGVDVEFIVKA